MISYTIFYDFRTCFTDLHSPLPRTPFGLPKRRPVSTSSEGPGGVADRRVRRDHRGVSAGPRKGKMAVA